MLEFGTVDGCEVVCRFACLCASLLSNRRQAGRFQAGGRSSTPSAIRSRMSSAAFSHQHA